MIAIAIFQLNLDVNDIPALLRQCVDVEICAFTLFAVSPTPHLIKRFELHVTQTGRLAFVWHGDRFSRADCLVQPEGRYTLDFCPAVVVRNSEKCVSPTVIMANVNQLTINHGCYLHAFWIPVDRSSFCAQLP